MSLNPARSFRVNREIPWISLIYTTIFVAAVAVLVIALSNQVTSGKDVLSLTIIDPDGNPIEDARITWSDALYLSDSGGQVHLEVHEDHEMITVERDGYMTVTGEFDTSHAREQTLTLQTLPNDLDRATPTDSAGAAPAAATAAASPAGSPGEVAGKLLSEDGSPIASGWVTAHSFRHSFGVHLLSNGCDIRYIKELLGHSSLHTTQIYTRVDKHDLSRVIDECHPRTTAVSK